MEVVPIHKELIRRFYCTYCERAHRLLAEAGLAPKLFECRSGISDCFMVVMEHLGLGWKPMSSFEGKVVATSVFEDIEKAVKILNNNNFVHGNLRASNVMVDPSGTHAKLIGFDWACEDGKNHYPLAIDEDDEYDDLHPDAAKHAKMRKEHDVYALENTLKPAYMPPRSL